MPHLFAATHVAAKAADDWILLDQIVRNDVSL